MTESTKRIAVVTGANRGIGFGVCELLARRGVVVILTARNEERGLEAVRKLKERESSSDVIFHQLDVADQTSVDSLAGYIKNNFGKLDILINNAGVAGLKLKDNVDPEKYRETIISNKGQVNWLEFLTETPELMEECFSINYYGAKRMCEAMLPFLLLSEGPTVVNVSSSMGTLKNVSYERAKMILQDVDKLSEEGLDELLKECLRSYREESACWGVLLGGYTLSKAAMNAYTRIVHRKYPSIVVNAVCPGFVSTDINFNTGTLSIEEGAQSIARLALLPAGAPSGRFFNRSEEASF